MEENKGIITKMKNNEGKIVIKFATQVEKQAITKPRNSQK